MSTNHSDKIIKNQLTDLLTKAQAHATLDEALGNLSIENAGKKPADLPYSIWKLAEHIRITQWDILRFSTDPDHKSPDWPAGYWPGEDAPLDENAWKNSLQQIRKDRDEFIALLNRPETDLYAPFPYGSGQNFLREAMLIADHTSYHTSEIIVIRRLLNDWH